MAHKKRNEPPKDTRVRSSKIAIEQAKSKNSKILVLSRYFLEDFPFEILRFKDLVELYLDHNNLTFIPNEIGQLKNLRILDIGSNSIFNLPESIYKLTNLEELRINNNRITNISSSIGYLTSLQKLDLSNNQLKTLPRDISSLFSLESIRCSNNQFRQLPLEITNLWNLQDVDFSENSIKLLPSSINQLSKLRTLKLGGNQLDIPPEIIEKSEQPRSIINFYLSRLDKAKKPLNEVKMLVVGQGSVGKTSLVNLLINHIFNPKEEKTDGISISRLSVSTNLLNQISPDIQINIWDFGGQEIMHATHQFFLTKRSLYMLVLDARITQEENRVEYWLKIIQSFGGESPVLIVGNKIDQHRLDIDRTGLKKKYPNIVDIVETSAATGAGLERLKSTITEKISHLPHVRDLLPETWFTVKTKLEGLGRESNFITHDKYLELCAENEVSDETSQRTLIGFLHDLGVVLHFQDDPRLEALGILNPQWVTNGVYKILNSHTLFQNKGVLTVSMLDEILNLPEYPRGKRLFIVDMMKKFELCYDIEPDKTFLVPDLLPKDQPDLNFNGVPAFEYAYPVLPSSVITRFIVRMNQKIDDGFVWRTGVVLKIGENKALVKADIEDRKITIAIDGVEYSRRDALSAIRYELGEIHNSIKGLNPQQRVPVPNAPLAEPLKYDYLLKLERSG